MAIITGVEDSLAETGSAAATERDKSMPLSLFGSIPLANNVSWRDKVKSRLFFRHGLGVLVYPVVTMSRMI